MPDTVTAPSSVGSSNDMSAETPVVVPISPTPPSHAPPSVRLRLVGGFDLEIDGCSIELQPAVRRLTALVALTPRGLCRDFAAFQLWPDKAENRAKANLRSTIWRLHQVPRSVVVASTTTLRLSSDVWLDLRDGLEDIDDQGLGLARPFGTLLLDLLPDWYDEWLDVERERFRQLRLASLELRARDAIRADDQGQAIQLALAALAIDGTRESSHRLLVEAHLAEGNESEAARERSRFARCLEYRLT